jgi:hypothetical protein
VQLVLITTEVMISNPGTWRWRSFYYLDFTVDVGDIRPIYYLGFTVEVGDSGRFIILVLQ